MAESKLLKAAIKFIEVGGCSAVSLAASLQASNNVKDCKRMMEASEVWSRKVKEISDECESLLKQGQEVVKRCSDDADRATLEAHKTKMAFEEMARIALEVRAPVVGGSKETEQK